MASTEQLPADTARRRALLDELARLSDDAAHPGRLVARVNRDRARIIRALRDDLGMPVAEQAETIGVHKTTLHKVLRTVDVPDA
jgi:DNA-binding MarR family transcriptional regulator